MGLKKENVPLAALLHFINSTAMTTERTEPIAATFQPSTLSQISSISSSSKHKKINQSILSATFNDDYDDNISLDAASLTIEQRVNQVLIAFIEA